MTKAPPFESGAVTLVYKKGQQSVHGLGSALQSTGYTVEFEDALSPPLVSLVAKALQHSPVARPASTYAADRMLYLRSQLQSVARRRVPQIMFSSACAVAPGIPYVTFEDMTVAQAARDGSYRGISGLTQSHIQWWMRRQHSLYLDSVACCVASTWAAESVVNDYTISPDKVKVVGYGHSIPLVGIRRRDWQIPRFLFAGRDWSRKNGARLIEAFTRVQRVRPDARLHLVGEIPEGKLSELSGVTVHGPLHWNIATDRKALRELFSVATCYVMPSILEAFGTTYLEAGAHGVPSIGTKHGGAVDAIGAGGALVDPFDVEAIATTMVRLTDPVEAQRLGVLAYRHACGLTWDAVAARAMAAFNRDATIEPVSRWVSR